MTTDTKIARYGNSLTVRLPVAIAREFDLRDGDRVTLRTVDDAIMIERPKRSRLAARIATVLRPEAEVSTGHAVGEEIIE
jgi:antitoxin component of MazEF toxin-antitoxin module